MVYLRNQMTDDMENVEEIDLSLFRKTGEGANGSSYDSVENPDMMIKLYNTDYPSDTIFSELEVARKVYSVGVPSPEPGVMVTDGTRLGIMFHRIAGKRSFSRAFADEPERTKEYARELAAHCRKLHQIECPKGFFPDAKLQFRHLVDASKTFDASRKKVIYDFIDSVPEVTTALHGDMHMGNVLTTLPAGAPMEQPHDVKFIDLGYFSCGYPLFDLGMMKMICLTSDEEFRVENFHITGEHTAKIWEYFVDEYFQGTKTLVQANELIAPFQAVKMFLVEYNLGFMPENYATYVKEVFEI